MRSNAISVLLVEDDNRDARLTVSALQSGNKEIQITVVGDGEEALDFLFCRAAYVHRSPQHPPQLILLDLKLPKVNGLQVLEEIKRRPETKAIPVVALTSSREEKDIAACYQFGVNSYIQKPVDFEQFRQAIRMVGLYWTTINEQPPDKLFPASTSFA